MTDDIVPPLKRCTKCGEEKPLHQFNRNRNCSNGIENQCRVCTQIRRESYRRQNGMKPAHRVQYLDGKRQCSKCKEYKYTSEFTAHTNTLDKLSSHCKSCKYAHQEQKRRDNGAQPACRILHIDGGKICSKCKLWKPLTEYRKASKSTDGLTSSCKTCAAIQQRDYYQRNRDSIRQWNTQYQLRYPERRRAARQRYQQKNTQSARIHTRNRRARKRSLQADFTVTEWRRALDYFDHSCAVCLRSLVDLFGERSAHADHWIPLTKDGATTALNIIPLCGGRGGCNNSKQNKHAETWLIERFGKRKAKQILERINAYFEWVKQQ